MGKQKFFTEEERKEARRRSYQKHREEILERQKLYNKEHKDERSEYMKQYRQNHKDEIAEKAKQYRQNHKDEKAVYDKQYYQNNREKKLKNSIQRYSTKKGRANCLIRGYKKQDKDKNRGECTLTADWIVENVFSGQCCNYCGESDWAKLGVDRKDSSLPHTQENCVPCCRKCNEKKHTTEYDEFMRLIKKVG
ncbi:MAG: hypothetical protein J6Y78_01755 [Paludibacteraceae bacterium]|nr:hypothetical protein [Paludibacteraceae bacterium]